MLVGYMRISTADERQSVDLQRDALQVAGVDERHLHEIVCPELAMTAPASRPASPI
jgi:DNA invertase Pin-like site-specific DNA recombinase